MKEDSTKLEMRKGLLVLAVLRVISKKSMYAAEILASLADTEFATQEGTLYPLLSKLKRDELIDHEWKESRNGPPRKYFKLSQKGRSRMNDLMEHMKLLDSTLTNLGGHNE
jgi:PadR family transcriptional regulator PadR